MKSKIHPIFKCPLCGTSVGPYARGIALHAKAHDITVEKLWMALNNINEPPRCKCKPNCNESVTWKSWEVGYSDFFVGHYDANVRSANTRSILETSHWSRGKTKEDCEILSRSSKNISRALKEGFYNGKIKHWASGHTKKTHESLRNKIGKKREQHHNWCEPKLLLNRINESARDLFLIKNLDDSEISEKTLGNRINNKQTSLSVKCLRCNSNFTRSIYGIIRGRLQCSNCDWEYSSKIEKEIFDFVSKNYSEMVHKRKKFNFGELDIYVPSKKFAIEVNGLYWHSEAVNDDHLYHQKKSDGCINAGINLFHVFEDDWNTKRSVVESMILHKLGLTPRSIGARKCRVIQLTTKQRKDFFEANHVEGDVASSYSIGLLYENSIVAAASFRKPFHKKWKEHVELARFSTSLNTSVPGALGKLMKDFLKRNPGQKIMSYQDTRLGGKKSYEIAGFKLFGETGVSFWWTDTIKRYNRFSVRSKDGVAENEISIGERKLKIWGTKNLIWLYD